MSHVRCGSGTTFSENSCDVAYRSRDRCSVRNSRREVATLLLSQMRDRAPARIAVRLEANHIEVSSRRILSAAMSTTGNGPVNPSGGNQESRPTSSGDRSLNKYGGA